MNIQRTSTLTTKIIQLYFPHEKYGMNEMSGQEILQQVIHEDFKRIVDDMNQFRVETISQVQNKQLAGTKYAMCKRWVCFYQNMICCCQLGLATSGIRAARPSPL